MLILPESLFLINEVTIPERLCSCQMVTLDTPSLLLLESHGPPPSSRLGAQASVPSLTCIAPLRLITLFSLLQQFRPPFCILFVLCIFP